MITSDAQLQQVIEQMGRMYRALRSIQEQQAGEGWQSILAEGPVEELRRLQAEVDAYVGLAAPREQEARDAHERLDRALDRLVTEEIETRTGVLREIDLDARTFLLRGSADANEIRCTFAEEFYETAKAALDRQVRVSGAIRRREGRRGAALLHMTRLEILDDAPGDDDAGGDAKST